MSCKVRLYFYDSNSEKEVACPQNCHLLINGENAEGETQQEATSLTFSYSTPLPGSGGYAFDKWAFSLSGVSFTPTTGIEDEETGVHYFTQDVTDVGYLEVRCCLAPQKCHISYHFNNPDTTESTYQEPLYADPYCKLIDAPSFLNDGKIMVFVGWKTTESVEGAASITDEYAKDTAYAKYVKFWKNDVNGTKIYYQVMTAISATDNTDWDAMADRIVRLGANGDIYYSALSYYAPTALNVKMDAVWKSPTNSSLYPEGEIVYEDEDGNVIGRETAYSDTNVTAKGDDDFKGMAIDEWKTADGKTVKKGSTVKTSSGSTTSGWSMHFHVSMAVKKQYWVRYDAGGGKVQPEPEPVAPGTTIQIKALPKKKDSHGQYTVSATCWQYGGGGYLPDDDFVVNSDVTFKASYKTREVTITYDPGKSGYVIDADKRTQKAYVGTGKYSIPTVKDSKGNVVTPQSWKTGLKGKTVADGGKVSNVDDHKVTAQWLPTKLVYLNPNGGTVDGKSTEVTTYLKIYDDAEGKRTDRIVGHTVARTGWEKSDIKHDALGDIAWFTSTAMDAKTAYDASDAKNVNTNPIRLYVKWGQLLTLDPNGGTPGATYGTPHNCFGGEKYGTITRGDKTGLPTGTDVSKSGYQLVGWFDKASGGNRVTDASTIPNKSTRTLYARWTANKQTVTFNAMGGTIEKNTEDYDKTGKYDSFPVAQYSRGGFITKMFLGWFTASTGGEEVKDGDSVSQEDTRTLYAHYSERRKVSFFTEGGYNTSPYGMKYTFEEYFTVGKTYAKGHISQDPYSFPVPSRDGGWTFKGWWTDRISGTQVTEDMMVEDATDTFLHAHWENDKEVATITYDYNGGIAYVPDKNVYEGDRAGALPLPQKDGYSPTGWHKQSVALAATRRDGEVTGELITSTTIINESMTVKMGWSKKIFLYYAIAPQGNS